MNTREKIVQLNPDECIIKPKLLADDSSYTILSFSERWHEIISYACDPSIVSILIREQNQFNDPWADDIQLAPPVSLYGKLLAFLFRRFQHFKGSRERGLDIILQNHHIAAQKMEAILLELAHLNDLEPDVFDWIESSVRFVAHSAD